MRCDQIQKNRLREQGVASSNLAAPTINPPRIDAGMSVPLPKDTGANRDGASAGLADLALLQPFGA
jgi:hypothetical protein